jgi:predicted secreted protein
MVMVHFKKEFILILDKNPTTGFGYLTSHRRAVDYKRWQTDKIHICY